MPASDLDRARRAAAAILDADPDDVRISVRRSPGRQPAYTDAALDAAIVAAGSVRGAARVLGVAESGVRKRLASRRVTDGKREKTT